MCVCVWAFSFQFISIINRFFHIFPSITNSRFNAFQNLINIRIQRAKRTSRRKHRMKVAKRYRNIWRFSSMKIPTTYKIHMKYQFPIMIQWVYAVIVSRRRVTSIPMRATKYVLWQMLMKMQKNDYCRVHQHWAKQSISRVTSFILSILSIVSNSSFIYYVNYYCIIQRLFSNSFIRNISSIDTWVDGCIGRWTPPYKMLDYLELVSWSHGAVQLQTNGSYCNYSI